MIPSLASFDLEYFTAGLVYKCNDIVHWKNPLWTVGEVLKNGHIYAYMIFLAKLSLDLAICIFSWSYSNIFGLRLHYFSILQSC